MVVAWACCEAGGRHRVSMPDTPQNQAKYPQPSTKAPGIGLPLARLVMVICLVSRQARGSPCSLAQACCAPTVDDARAVRGLSR